MLRSKTFSLIPLYEGYIAAKCVEIPKACVRIRTTLPLEATSNSEVRLAIYEKTSNDINKLIKIGKSHLINADSSIIAIDDIIIGDCVGCYPLVIAVIYGKQVGTSIPSVTYVQPNYDTVTMTYELMM